MPIVNYQQYCEMLQQAAEGHYAYPAINVSNAVALTAAIEGLVQAGSDGIIQFSPTAGANASGSLKDPVLGCIMLAEYAHHLAGGHHIHVALQTDHCAPELAEPFIGPLLAETARRRKAGLPNLFSSHMLDASMLPLKENLALSQRWLERCVELEIILEVEIGVVGGEEDGLNNEGAPRAKLYSTPQDMLAVHEALSPIAPVFLLAATFGNVHGVYKPGQVQLKPAILKEGRDALRCELGNDARFFFVFHGGSGSSPEEIQETLRYGVVKMNIDTDAQYTFTRAVADHIMRNYEGVLKIDGEVGSKKMYDPRAYLNKARDAMAARVVQACRDLNSFGKSLGI